MMIGRACLALSILAAIAAVMSAAMGQFATVAPYFVSSLLWFDIYLMRNRIRLLMIDWEPEK